MIKKIDNGLEFLQTLSEVSNEKDESETPSQYRGQLAHQLAMTQNEMGYFSKENTLIDTNKKSAKDSSLKMSANFLQKKSNIFNQVSTEKAKADETLFQTGKFNDFN